MSDNRRSGANLTKGKHNCVNCGSGTKGNQFEGVIVCDSCLATIMSTMGQVDKQLGFIKQLMCESIRVALLERRFGGHTIPQQSGVRPPSKEEVRSAIERIFTPLTGKPSGG